MVTSIETKVAVTRSIEQIVQMLTKHGARSIRTDYDQHGSATGLSFALMTPWGIREFALPVRVPAVAAALKRLKAPLPAQRPEQVSRIAWRNAHDWVKVQLNMIEIGMTSTEEVFFPYLVLGTDEAGEITTAFQHYTRTQKEISS